MFQTYEDNEGRVDVGLLDNGVVYARLAGGLSARVGTMYASYLGIAVARSTRVYLFSDGSRLNHYDLLARSAFLRVVLENRRRFAGLTFLTWAEGISTAARAFAEAVGQPLDIITDPAEFEVLLTSAAPDAPRRIARAIPTPPLRTGGGTLP